MRRVVSTDNGPGATSSVARLLVWELRQVEIKLKIQVEPGLRRKLGFLSCGQQGTQKEPSAGDHGT